MKRTLAFVTSAAALMAATTLGTPEAAAATWETDYVSPGEVACAGILSAPSSDGWVCFQPYGDVWMVSTSPTDSGRISVQWENRLRNASGAWVTYRTGQCINDLGRDQIGVCNKDYYENSSYNALGGYGSMIRYKACTSVACTNFLPWQYNNA